MKKKIELDDTEITAPEPDAPVETLASVVPCFSMMEKNGVFRRVFAENIEQCKADGWKVVK